MPSKKIHALAIFGTRPEALKVMPVVDAIRALGVHQVTALAVNQQGDVLSQALAFVGRPDRRCGFVLGPKDASRLHRTFGSILWTISGEIEQIRPDYVIVQGDTTTALAGAMAAMYCKVPVCHVEAGLRTYDPMCPWPEEHHRTIISQIATWHMCPTIDNVTSLIQEGIIPRPLDETYEGRGPIFLTGNPILDTLRKVECYKIDGRFIVFTMHRRENFGTRMRNACEALVEILERFPDVEAVVPIHPNPACNVIRSLLAGHDRISLVDPMDYPDFVSHLKSASLVMSDSGGVVEECCEFGTPLLILREKTERMEAVDGGFAFLCDPGDVKCVVEDATLALREPWYLKGIPEPGRSGPRNPFAGGQESPSRRIAEILAGPYGPKKLV